MYPVSVTVLIKTPRCTVVRLNPDDPAQMVWYSIRVNACWRMEDLMAAREVLPAGVECEGSYVEGPDHYFDMSSPLEP